MSEAALVEQFPMYSTRKVVRAAKIVADPFRRPRFEDGAFAISVLLPLGIRWFPVDHATEMRLATMRPQAGWYLVIYEGGFVSCTPPKEFEKAATATV